MRNKGFFTGVVAILTAICLYYFAQTFYANKIEDKAKIVATIKKNGQDYVDPAKEKKYLDSVVRVDTTGILTYRNASEAKLKLGLDLKGGMNVMLEVSEKDILVNLSNNSQNPTFLKAIEQADKAVKGSGKSYTDLFFENFKAIGTTKLASSEVFGNTNFASQIRANSSDAEVENIVRSKVKDVVNEARNVVETRIDKFGVASPVVQQVQNTGRINVELPGVKDTDRIKKMLQSTAKLEFYGLDYNSSAYFDAINQIAMGKTPTTAADTATVKKDSTATVAKKDSAKAKPATASSIAAKTNTKTNVSNKPVLTPIGPGQALVNVSDTARVNKIMNTPEARKALGATGRYTKMAWGAKPVESKEKSKVEQVILYALQGDRTGNPTLSGDIIAESKTTRDPNNGQIAVSLQMTTEGAKDWSRVTGQYVGRQLAIVLDNQVYSAPNINEPMNSGNAQITGGFSQSEADDLANILNAGKMPASAKIIQAEVVGPSLGQEAIDAGMLSFLIAAVVVSIYMIFYFAGAGVIADISLMFNMIFVVGILMSFGAVLTLPGIAGIVLTIATAVDANVLIFDRVKEELLSGKEKKQAIADGFRFALPSILDANILIFLTALVLGYFGTGPIRGFAVTLGIGIITALISSLIVSRLILSYFPNVTFYTSITKNWFKGINFDFIGKKNYGYIISTALTVVGLISLFTKGLDKGIDFVGGRTFTIRYEKKIDAAKMTDDLGKFFKDENGNELKPQVKIFGESNQVKIITKYKIDSKDEESKVDKEIIDILYNGTKQYLPAGYTRQAFEEGSESKQYGVMSYNKVGASVADDLLSNALKAIGFCLVVVFIYILIRFKKWQFSLGAIVALVHDSLTTLGIFSILKGIAPFSVEIDQAFIAAILTVIGYSLNDTVIVFDRVREDIVKFPNMPFGKLMNHALNSTLSRTLTTSMITMTIILIIFFFGGDTIRGFMFALAIGVGVGTYSSLFVACPLTYDLMKGSLKEEDKKPATQTKK